MTGVATLASSVETSALRVVFSTSTGSDDIGFPLVPLFCTVFLEERTLTGAGFLTVLCFFVISPVGRFLLPDFVLIELGIVFNCGNALLPLVLVGISGVATEKQKICFRNILKILSRQVNWVHHFL